MVLPFQAAMVLLALCSFQLPSGAQSPLESVPDEYHYLEDIDSCIACTVPDISTSAGCMMSLLIECNRGTSASELLKGNKTMPSNMCTEVRSGEVGRATWVYVKGRCLHSTSYTAEQISIMLQYSMGFPSSITDTIVPNMMDGQALSKSSVSDLKDLGWPPGLAINFVALIKDFMEPDRPVDPDYAKHAPIRIHTTLVVTSIFDINEVDFSFDASFYVLLTWRDLSLYEDCDASNEGIYEDGCTYVWRPKVEFMNARSFDLVSESLQAYPEHGTATSTLAGRGTFSATMGFRQFPGDVQALPIEIGFRGSNEGREAWIFDPVIGNFAPSFFSTDGKDSISGWEPVDVVGSEAPYVPLDLDQAAGNEGGHMRFLVDQLAAARGVGSPSAPGASTLSSARVVIRVRRLKNFYTLNYVMLVVVLTALSWSVFLVEASGLADRVQIALALVLALNVFQLILNDNMPKTGYLTPMHEYIIGSTIFVVLTSFESVLVARCAERSAVREAAVGRMKAAVTRVSPVGSKMTERGGGTVEEGGGGSNGRVGGGGDYALEHPRAGGAIDTSTTATSIDWATKAEEWAGRNLDRASLVLFPIAYAIFTAVILV